MKNIFVYFFQKIFSIKHRQLTQQFVIFRRFDYAISRSIIDFINRKQTNTLTTERHPFVQLLQFSNQLSTSFSVYLNTLIIAYLFIYLFIIDIS